MVLYYVAKPAAAGGVCRGGAAGPTLAFADEPVDRVRQRAPPSHSQLSISQAMSHTELPTCGGPKGLKPATAARWQVHLGVIM